VKILYLHQYFVFPEEAGGTRSFDLAKSFVELGYSVDVITTSAFIKSQVFTKRWTVIQRDGFTVYVLKMDYSNKLSYAYRVWAFLQFLIYASIKLLKLKGDLVLATSTPLTIGVPAMIKRLFHKTPFIFETRDVWPEAVEAVGAITNPLILKALYRLEEFIYHQAEAIVALSVDMKMSITSRYLGLCDKQVIVIENISQIERFQQQSVETNSGIDSLIGFKPRFVVLYAGTFGRVNGLGYCLDLAAMTLKKDKSIAFLLMGSGSEKLALIERAKKIGVYRENVFFLESVSKSELPNMYQLADMGSSFVINSEVLWANSANKFFDSLAAGKPILINYKGWQSNVITGDDVGYVLPTNDKLDVLEVEKFIRYTYNSNGLSQQNTNALNCAKNRYSLDVAVKKYQDLFDTIV